MSSYEIGTAVEILVGSRRGQVGKIIRSNVWPGKHQIALCFHDKLFYNENEIRTFNDRLETHSRQPYGGKESSSFGYSIEDMGEPFVNDRR